MRQRVMIAMALSLNPRLVIADEPTTALDSTVQAQILELLDEMRREFDATIVMITHDLNVLGRVADTLMVMYAGHRLELGPADQVFGPPVHPYTAGLLRSSPSNYAAGHRARPHPRTPAEPAERRPGLRVRRALPGGDGAVPQRAAAAAPLRERQRGAVLAGGTTRRDGRAARGAHGAAAGHRGQRHPPQLTDTAASPPLVRLDGVELSFRDKRRREDVQVLRGIDLTVESGRDPGAGRGERMRQVDPRPRHRRAHPGRLRRGRGGRAPALGDQQDEWRELRRDVQLIFQDPYGVAQPPSAGRLDHRRPLPAAQDLLRR